jgi:hypothetical protein
MAAKRSAKNATPPAGSSARIARRAAGALLTVAVVSGLVWGVKWLGDSARRGIAPRDRYTVLFGDIECDAPAGFHRRVFLAEVEYHSRFPSSFQSLDPDLTPKLTAAFAAHPWVAAVESVAVEPPSTVRVKLKFRVPALAVALAGAPGKFRVVDTTGVLLPLTTDPGGLPELVTPVLAPVTPSGKPWADDTVKRAVELVEAHRPRRLEKTPAGWRLTTSDGKTVLVER